MAGIDLPVSMISSGAQMSKPGPRPHVWRSGPDPERHRRYRAWIQQKNQAQWRGEDWQLSFEDWLMLWGTDFDRRGRGSKNLCLTRWDLDAPWTKDNCILMERGYHMQRCGRRSQDADV
jgi:hypothetical protein